MTDGRQRLGPRDYLWVALAVLLVVATAIVLDLTGLADTSTRAAGLAIAGLSAMAGGAATEYRRPGVSLLLARLLGRRARFLDGRFRAGRRRGAFLHARRGLRFGCHDSVLRKKCLRREDADAYI